VFAIITVADVKFVLGRRKLRLVDEIGHVACLSCVTATVLEYSQPSHPPPIIGEA
jgi:hypothetical protein